MSKATDQRIELHALLHSTTETIQRAIKLELAQYKMSQSQVRVLHLLSINKDLLNLNQLSQACIRELNSITTLINRMQKNGLVKKVKKPGDNRTYIALTEKGEDIYNNTVTERSITLVFDALSSDEKKQLASLLSKLQTKARNLLGLDYRPPFLQKD
jgi:DNA-binding MarR family transcriptional regulator